MSSGMLRFVPEEPPLSTTTHAVSARRRSITVSSVILLAFGALALFARLRSPLPLAAYDDDAFYYFQLARNIATGHGSTFDGVHLTNGYHPLWMLVCVVVAWLAKGKAFFLLLQCVAFLSLATSYFAARSLFRFVSQKDGVVEVAAGAITLQCLILIHGGMEITLSLPFALLLCLFRLRPAFSWNTKNALAYGGLAVLVVLSRLDGILWVALLLCAEFVLARRNHAFRLGPLLIAILTTTAPLAVYAIANHHWFHAWMPVSATAKELRLHHGFTLTGLRASLFLLHQVYGLLLIYPALLLVLCALIAILWRRGPIVRPEIRAVVMTLLLFPVVQFAAQGFLSDWQIWSWYLYSFTLAAAGALLYLMASVPGNEQVLGKIPYLVATLACAASLLLGSLYAISTAAGKETPHWVEFAHDLQQFATNHPGTYAMGDCAGTSGYLLQQPILQTEGLVMDPAFLDNIRQQKDLRQVMQSYGVRYYATFRAIPQDGCFHVEEPYLAGPDSPRMRSTLCQAPVASYPVGPVVFRIFDLTSPAR